MLGSIEIEIPCSNLVGDHVAWISPLHTSVRLQDPSLLLRVGGLVVIGEVNSVESILRVLPPKHPPGVSDPCSRQRASLEVADNSSAPTELAIDSAVSE